jgi:NADP-dependent 3-hydroxy acid dehydrogenase YdfG
MATQSVFNLDPQETTSLSGKRILLTGGSTGIGRATLIALAKEGAKLLTYARNQGPLDQALQFAGLGEDAAVIADQSRPEDLDRVFQAADERLGGLDAVICNAALGAEPIHEMKEEDWRYAVETNLIGYMACVRRALERMIPQGRGHIVMISSISADILAPGESVYAATKAGIDAFALTLRKEVMDKGIKISMIAPGSVGSDMQQCTAQEQREAIAKEEMLFAEEIAEAVKFILTRSHRCDVVDLRIEPRMQKVA